MTVNYISAMVDLFLIIGIEDVSNGSDFFKAGILLPNSLWVDDNDLYFSLPQCYNFMYKETKFLVLSVR